MRKLVISALAAMIAVSCSIKEERSGCPSWLSIRLSEKSLAIARSRTVLVTLRHAEGNDTLRLDSAEPGGWAKVGRGVAEMDGLLLNGAALTVPWGGESDSLWTCSTRVPVLSDEETVTVELHKRFATVDFIFESLPDTGGLLLVLRGDFHCLLAPSEKTASVRLPAQREDTVLELECLAASEGRKIWDWDLAGALRTAGYDWGAEDLADIRVRVSLAPLDLRVEIIPWEGGATLKLEI